MNSRGKHRRTQKSTLGTPSWSRGSPLPQYDHNTNKQHHKKSPVIIPLQSKKHQEYKGEGIKREHVISNERGEDADTIPEGASRPRTRTDLHSGALTEVRQQPKNQRNTT